MANTLKFGNGNWAIKEDSTLAYSDQYDNFKPLPFDFTRASNATVVNKDGLIETVANGIPRIDFLGSEDGALLLEPQRTNLITQSEAFDNSSYLKIRASISANQITSPNGNLNADKFIEDNSNGTHLLWTSDNVVSIGDDVTWSVFAKKGEREWILLRDLQAGGFSAYFDLNNGVIGSISGTLTPNIENMGNGWFRCSISYTTITAITRGRIYSANANNGESYQGDGTSGFYIFGAQIEQGSYPTSYIPTQGSAVTRLADSCSQTPPSGVIGQTEGTLFLDVNISHIVGSEAIGGINSGGYANHVTINRAGNTIQFVRNSATQSGVMVLSSSAITVGTFKLAIAYKSGDTACFLNGTQVSTTQTQTFTSGTLNLLRISGDAIGAIPFADTYNQVKLYNTRLSNSELATLTTI